MRSDKKQSKPVDNQRTNIKAVTNQPNKQDLLAKRDKQEQAVWFKLEQTNKLSPLSVLYNNNN